MFQPTPSSTAGGNVVSLPGKGVHLVNVSTHPQLNGRGKQINQNDLRKYVKFQPTPSSTAGGNVVLKAGKGQAPFSAGNGA
jgi:hypothetical protein